MLEFVVRERVWLMAVGRFPVVSGLRGATW